MIFWTTGSTAGGTGFLWGLAATEARTMRAMAREPNARLFMGVSSRRAIKGGIIVSGSERCQEVPLGL
jgi:hypothetical protein